MPTPQDPFKSRSREYTAISSPVAFSPPIGWIKVVGSGNLTLKDEAGTAVTFTAVAAGEVIAGPFSEITSMTATKIRVGDGAPPPSELVETEASAATSLETRISTEESTQASADTSVVSRLSAADSALTSSDASIVSRFSAVDSGLTSADASIVSRFSASVSTLTSADTSLTTRISIAESTEASVH